MSESSAEDRTEDPTSKRLEDARKKGQVVRSRELNTLLSLLGSGVALFWFGPELMDDISSLLTESLSFTGADIQGPTAIQERFFDTGGDILLAMLPFLGFICLISLVGPGLIGGWAFNGELLFPKFERMDPLKGIARMFSMKGALELVKAIMKVGLVSAITFGVMSMVLDDLLTLPLQQIDDALTESGNMFLWCFIGFSSALLLVAGIDVPYQLWNHHKELRMTKQEVKDEMKESDGNPEVKMAIRRKQQEMTQSRMMSAVPGADVVITNPTHYAVALKYDHAKGKAPIVIAKGKDLIAAKIREIAKENGITVFSAPPLARALYASTDIDKEIPENLFVAVAQVLAYIYQLRRAIAARRPAPQPPANLPVPDEYDRSRKL
jgi:flagellar biosynthetic protein FlhB